jgi:uncharacterized protein YdhG (YjbR/CyaY superfamily)
MPTKKPARKSSNKPAKAPAKAPRFTDDERDAMRERAEELKAAARRGSADAEGESDVLAKIAAMKQPDRAMAEQLHALIKATVPELAARTWYGMPAYAKDGNVVCYFQPALRFKTRYGTLGFSDKAKLDDGAMWPVVFAVKELTAAEKARIAALLKQAVS